MCTLTYIPGKDGYILTHNRDERIDRPASVDLRTRRNGSFTSYFPQDLEAMGSWIGFSNRGISACILNGGEKPYQRKSKYRKSRGLVVLESLEYDQPMDFFQQSNLEDIEPFTLIIRSRTRLCMLMHEADNNNMLVDLDPEKYHIWSSSTLYTDDVRQRRESWFSDWLNSTSDYTSNNIRHFHLHAGEGDEGNDLVMSRRGVLKTLSITQIEVKGKRAEMLYHNLHSGSKDQKSIELIS